MKCAGSKSASGLLLFCILVISMPCITEPSSGRAFLIAPGWTALYVVPRKVSKLAFGNTHARGAGWSLSSTTTVAEESRAGFSVKSIIFRSRVNFHVFRQSLIVQAECVTTVQRTQSWQTWIRRNIFLSNHSLANSVIPDKPDIERRVSAGFRH